MKQATAAVVVVAFGLAAAPTMAQDRYEQEKHQQRAKQVQQNDQTQQSAQVLRLGKLIGREVETTDGAQVGEIVNFAVDTQSHDVPLVVMQVSGGQNANDRLVPVPFKAFDFTQAVRSDGPVTIQAKASQLRNAPSFSRDQWPNLNNQEWNQRIEQHFRSVSSSQSQSRDQFESRERYEHTQRAPRAGDREDSNYPGLTGNQAGGVAGDPDEQTWERTASTSSGDRDQWSQQSRSRSESSSQQRSTTTVKATSLLDAELQNRENNDIGSVEDVLVDARTGQIAYVVMATGGFLGMGERLHAVPFEAINVRSSSAQAQPVLVLDIERDRLREAPTFDRNRWPTAISANRAREINSFYGVQEPTWVYGYSGSDRQDRSSGSGGIMDINSVISSWPQASQKAAREVMQKYGQPDAVSSTMVVWTDNGPWKRTTVFREGVSHQFPMQHTDVLEQVAELRVPAEKINELARFDESMMVYRTGNEVIARCDCEPMNFLALNLANEIINGKRSADDARQFLAQTAERFKQGESSQYTQQLMFGSGSGNRSSDRSRD